MRQRKDGLGESGYSMLIMNDSSKFLKLSVEDILKASPEAVRLFVTWHASCIGCGFARFCSLDYVIEAYQLDKKKILEDIEKLVAQKSKQGV